MFTLRYFVSLAPCTVWLSLHIYNSYKYMYAPLLSKFIDPPLHVLGYYICAPKTRGNKIPIAVLCDRPVSSIILL